MVKRRVVCIRGCTRGLIGFYQVWAVRVFIIRFLAKLFTILDMPYIIHRCGFSVQGLGLGFEVVYCKASATPIT